MNYKHFSYDFFPIEIYNNTTIITDFVLENCTLPLLCLFQVRLDQGEVFHILFSLSVDVLRYWIK